MKREVPAHARQIVVQSLTGIRRHQHQGGVARGAYLIDVLSVILDAVAAQLDQIR